MKKTHSNNSIQKLPGVFDCGDTRLPQVVQIISFLATRTSQAYEEQLVRHFPQDREGFEFHRDHFADTFPMFDSRLCVNQPSPVMKTCGFAVWASRWIATPSEYGVNETILSCRMRKLLAGPAK